MYDVIVIGARCAGSATARLLARSGYRVLLVDRARFPSDTLSTHQVQIKGGAALQRWGLYETVLGSNCPPAKKARFHYGPEAFEGNYPALGSVNAVVSPRRTILDKILVDAAVAAGAELREDVLVEDLTTADGRINGIRGRVKHGSSDSGFAIEEQARLVVGADGKHSLVARQVQAPEYQQKPMLSCAYYTYWAGLELSGGELYAFPGAAAGIFPTNDGLAVIYTGYPMSEFAAIRADIEGRFWRTIQSLPELSERLHAGRQAERFYGSADLPGFYRRPYGPGWALVGDAGMTEDPVTGQGIGNAFCEAERLAEAVDRVFSGTADFETAMAEYEQARNADTLPMYEFTAQIASFAPPSIEQQVMYDALAHKPEAAGQFFGVLSGSVPMDEFFSPSNMMSVIGASGMARVLLGKLKASVRGGGVTQKAVETAVKSKNAA